MPSRFPALLLGLAVLVASAACSPPKSCPGGFTDCEGRCVATSSDAVNCGACGNVCGAGTACVDGACATTCAAGTLACGGTCVDPLADAGHCGASGDCTGAAAGVACAAGEACVGGACARDCRPVALDLDTPFATAAPPFAAVAGQQAPTAFWGALPAPRPTNAAWQNLVVGAGQNRFDVVPYQVKAVPEGLALANAAPVTTATLVEVPNQQQLVLGALQPFTGHAVTAYDALSVTVRYAASAGTMTVPLVFGSPYVTAEYAGLTPHVLTGTFALQRVNGGTTTPVTGTRFELALADGSRWILYASSALTLDWSANSPNPGSLSARAPFTGTLRAANVPAGAPAAAVAALDDHAGAIPRGGRFEADVACDVATVRFVYQATGTGPLLLAALPHHRARLVAPAYVALAYRTLGGDAVGVEGDTWTMELSLSTTSWSAPRALAPAHVEEVRAALVTPGTGDVDFVPDAATAGGDPYFGGKQLAKLARLALIADELGEAATAATLRARLEPLVAAWLDGTNANPLVYDTTWGGVVTTHALADPGAEFGQGHYNDHHFHYGYHLYAAAVLARADPAFATRHRAGLLALVRDIANPSAADPAFPRFRTMDFFRGHSWAAGLTEFGDGQNQESTSEAANAWHALHLLGLATSDARLADLGRVLLALEVDAARTYWQIPAGSAVYGEPFAQNRCVGILFQTKATFATFFGPNPEFIYGIQMLPFTPATEDLLSPRWVADAWPRILATTGGATPGWKGLLDMAHAASDREAAWAEVSALSAWDDGNSRTNALWWVASRP